MTKSRVLGVMAAALLVTVPGTARAGGAYGMSGLNGGYRWDAAARTIGGQERSLSGGLRYSVQGGSWQAFRDLFTWSVTPSVSLFQQTVEEALGAWTAIDPVTGYGSGISFVADFSTSVVGVAGGGVNTGGAEIDLLAATSAGSWNVGDTGLRGESYFNAVGGTVTLTSGVAGYAAGAISGADVKLNSNAGAIYTLDVFRLLLTHEVGHALGFADVDAQAGPGGFFIDDNYDASSSATALATLTNSWAQLVNVDNPAASAGLSTFFVSTGNPGLSTPGVNIVMESFGLGGQFGDLTPLSNDDYGMRQFLYPIRSAVAIPETGTLTFAALGIVMLGGGGARRRCFRKQRRQ